jgi:hypothetical protein
MRVGVTTMYCHLTLQMFQATRRISHKTRDRRQEPEGKPVVNSARQFAQSTVKFLCSLQSFRFDNIVPKQKNDVVINSMNEMQMDLQKLDKFANSSPSSPIHAKRLEQYI